MGDYAIAGNRRNAGGRRPVFCKSLFSAGIGMREIAVVQEIHTIGNVTGFKLRRPKPCRSGCVDDPQFNSCGAFAGRHIDGDKNAIPSIGICSAVQGGS